MEHYWLVDWALTSPFTQQVVPHPAVNVVFRRDAAGPETAGVAGVGRTLFTVTLAGTGTVSGIQFRPGGFRPFWDGPVAGLTDRHVPLGTDPAAARAARSVGAAPHREGTDDERRRALDAFLLVITVVVGVARVRWHGEGRRATGWGVG